MNNNKIMWLIVVILLLVNIAEISSRAATSSTDLTNKEPTEMIDGTPVVRVRRLKKPRRLNLEHDEGRKFTGEFEKTVPIKNILKLKVIPIDEYEKHAKTV